MQWQKVKIIRHRGYDSSSIEQTPPYPPNTARLAQRKLRAASVRTAVRIKRKNFYGIKNSSHSKSSSIAGRGGEGGGGGGDIAKYDVATGTLNLGDETGSFACEADATCSYC
jgi:hypothetical protein